MQLGTQSTVYAQELLIHDGSQGQRTKRVHAGFVNSLGIFVFALQLEGEVVGQMTALVVSSKQPKCVGIPDLQGPQVQYALPISVQAYVMRTVRAYLDTEITPIHIVAQEQVARFCRIAPDFEQLHEVVVLPVDVTTHGDGGVHLQQVWLRLEDFGALLEDPQCLLLGQAALAVKVLLEELDVGFCAVMRREELLVGGRVEGRRLDV